MRAEERIAAFRQARATKHIGALGDAIYVDVDLLALRRAVAT